MYKKNKNLIVLDVGWKGITVTVQYVYFFGAAVVWSIQIFQTLSTKY